MTVYIVRASYRDCPVAIQDTTMCYEAVCSVHRTKTGAKKAMLNARRQTAINRKRPGHHLPDNRVVFRYFIETWHLGD